MELQELVKTFKELLHTENILEGVKKAVFSDSKNEIFEKYMECIDSELREDELQKIFQYYYADRKEKMQDYTPKSIGKLCAAATKNSGKVVYDLCAGSGALTIQKWADDPDKIFICEELDENVIPILLFNMSIRNMTGYVINRNALTLETNVIYKLTSGDKFSQIEKEEHAPDIQANEIISNPPYNVKLQEIPEHLKEKSLTSSNANFAFVMTALSRMDKNGKCAFVLPMGCLTSEPEKESRKYLVDAGLIERVITLPEKMFEKTAIGTCVLVFSRGNKTIKFYDCRKQGIQEEREQKGQYGGNSHENRVYKKTLNVLPENVINKVCGDCEAIKEFSNEVENSEIEKNNYSLAPNNYIPIDTPERPHREYADIMADINRIARERSIIKITCNEKTAKCLGIYEAAKIADEEKEELNETFKLLGGEYKHKKYITLTKSREIKIENQDKELVSSLIHMFLPMWKQHIFYLNEEENRLLAELRDAMIPDLMSGKLLVGGGNENVSKNI